MIYLELIVEFLEIGLFSIGGGLATLPYLYRLSDKYHWFSHAMLVDMIAVSESTPGPIGVNAATYAGFTAGGLLGGICATFSLVIPSFFIIFVIVHILDKFKENRHVKSAFYGIRPAVTALIGSAALGIAELTLLDIPAFKATHRISDILNYKDIILFAAVLFLLKKYNKHPVFYIAGAAAIGVVFKL
jgi:chromate transporter